MVPMEGLWGSIDWLFYLDASLGVFLYHIWMLVHNSCVVCELVEDKSRKILASWKKQYGGG